MSIICVLAALLQACARAGMLAQDGRCKTLDASADGYVRAEAVGGLMLRPLAAASGSEGGAGARVAALLGGAAVNQDGRSSSLTAPNGPAQQTVIRSALSSGGLQPGQVAGINLHGTGTALGDPIVSGWSD